MHSLYSELRLSAVGANTRTNTDYKVENFDGRFGLATIKLDAPGMEGGIKGFLRPAPLQQASYSSLVGEVESGAFSGQRAVIIGGSRGLGEIAAKLLAIGGADVKISYYRGEEEAEQLVKEIAAGGGKAASFQFNVLAPDCNSILGSDGDWVPTHLYYFATPFIASSTKGAFSTDIFEKFSAYYLTGFYRTTEPLCQRGLKNIFYPSTVYADEMPLDMGEYAVAKIAGEALCDFLEKSDPGINLYRPRLPRVETDQTVSMLPVDNANPVPVMVENLRSFMATQV